MTGRTDELTAAEPAQRRPSVFSRLYTGTGAFDIVGKRRRWYVLFAAADR